VRFVDAVALSDYVAPQMRSWRLGASMFTAFGVLALIVAGWGLYSVLAFDVTLRRRELGIRSALGAGTERLVGLVLKRALVLVAVGVAVGVTASWGAAPLVQPLLFRVRAADPTVYGLVALTLLAVAALAGSVPAWRATRVDPREALQAD
jgi:ABC-type antimicrobial peptide transport system permease subunit